MSRRFFSLPGSFKGVGFVLPVVVFLLLFVTYPLVTNFILTLTDKDGKFTGAKNLIESFKDRGVIHSLVTSITYVAGSVSGQLLLGTIIGLLLNREFRGKGFVRSLVMFPWVIPGAVAATTWAWMYHSDYGVVRYLINNFGIALERGLLIIPSTVLPALILVNIWKMSPFVGVMVLAGLKGIDPNLYEAAEVDGATGLQQLVYITLPQLRAILLTLLLLLTIWGFNSITLIFTMTRGGPAEISLIMPIRIYEQTFRYFQLNRAASESVILFFILLILIIAYLNTFAEREKE